MEHPELIVRFAVEPGSDPKAVQQAIDEQFQKFGDVRVEINREKPVRFSGAEWVDILKDAGIIISAGVIVLKQSREMSGELLKLIEQIVRGIRGIKAAVLETATKQVLIEEATADDIQSQLDRGQRTAKLPSFN